MIKFAYSKYELTPITDIGAVASALSRAGALIRVQWPNGKMGYADIHPWPELGDADLDAQLEALKKRHLSEQMEQTIWLAKRDAEARKKALNVFQGLPKVKNHFLINDILKVEDGTFRELKNSGFTTIKVKVGRNLDETAKAISRLIKQNPFMVRLDFNSKLDFPAFKNFIEQFSTAERAKIEFIEDPMPWNLENWKAASKFATLALDFEFDKVDWDSFSGAPPFKVMVIKPARQDVDKYLNLASKYDLKLVVTSSLDHPVGVAHALWIASEIKKNNPNNLLECGCLTIRNYKANQFSTRMSVAGPFMNLVSGTGIGFDDLLISSNWTDI